MIVNVCIDHRRTMKAFACAPGANGGGPTLTLAGLNVAFDADCCPSRDDDGATGFAVAPRTGLRQRRRFEPELKFGLPPLRARFRNDLSFGSTSR